MSAKRAVIPVFVPHLGCPNDCVFCNQRKISGSEKAPDPSELEAKISAAIERGGVKTNIQLAFYGGSFTAIPLKEQTALLEGALPFLRDGRLASLRVSTRPDCVDIPALERLKRCGVATVELGAQSMDEEVLRLSGRGHTAKDTENAAAMVREQGFELVLQMMTGLPGDTKEKTVETAKRLIALKPDGVRIYPTVIVRDTPLFDLWRAGEYREHTVAEAVDWCVAIAPLFEAAGIPVIRLGLNPTDELSGGQAAAGAYHPAFGELVRSRLLLDKARELLKNAAQKGEVTLEVNKADISAMTGQKRENLIKLQEEFSLQSIRVSPAEVGRGELAMNN